MSFNIDVAIATGAGSGTNTVNLVRNYTPGVTVGDAVYQKTDGTCDKADASAVATSEAYLGIVELIDAPLPGQATIRAQGDVATFAGLIPGQTYILSLTPGVLVMLGAAGPPVNYPVAPGTVIREVGSAVTPSTLFSQAGQQLEVN